MDLRVLVLFFLIGICRVNALSCRPCNETVCQTAANCPGSLTHDVCGCCLVCAGQPGEKCGGPWDVEGKCDVGLVCVAKPFTPPPIHSVPDLEIFEYVDAFFDQRVGTCQVYYEDCSDVCDYLDDKNNNPIAFSISGRSAVLKNHRTRRGYSAYCDCTDNKEAWMVMQRRTGDLESFDRRWMEYLAGFGSSNGDYWLGLELLNQLTQSRPHELEIWVKYEDGREIHSGYGIVRVGGEETQYQLTFESNIDVAGDSFQAMHNKMKFSTKDIDNDNWKTGECAKWFRGGWWYDKCTEYSLNGVYYPRAQLNEGPDRIRWNSNLAVVMVEMRIRPTEPLEAIASSGYDS